VSETGTAGTRVNRGDAPARSHGMGMQFAADDFLSSPEELTDRPVAESFEAFYAREMPRLLVLARALSGSASADDIAQDAMVTAYDRWETVSGYEAPGAWVRQVCANRAMSVLRRRAAEARALVRLGGRRAEAVGPLSEDTEAFWAEVRRLPRRQAQSIALFYIYDLGVAEIARTLGCSEGSVKVHLSRGRAALGARLGVEEGS
jgi:RNA polymerase sigma factor (sigma-70 family)